MGTLPRLCSCGNIVPAGIRCPCQIAGDHARKARHDHNRPTASQRGYTSQWRTASKAYLATHPICAMCNAPATLVDHITPHKGDDALFWDRANWQPLCVVCHSRHKQRQERMSVPF